jgi:hypothetical protein
MPELARVLVEHFEDYDAAKAAQEAAGEDPGGEAPARCGATAVSRL